MTHNAYPDGHESDPTQTAEQAFDATYDALMAREPQRTDALSIADVPVQGIGTLRTLQAYATNGRHRVFMTAQHIGQTRAVIVDVEVADGSSAGRGTQLLSVSYDAEPGPLGRETVTAQPVHFEQSLSAEDAAFVHSMGLGVAALRADQTHGGEMARVTFDNYFPEASEVAALASLPERANAYQG